jgi:hypothetical protein
VTREPSSAPFGTTTPHNRRRGVTINIDPPSIDLRASICPVAETEQTAWLRRLPEANNRIILFACLAFVATLGAIAQGPEPAASSNVARYLFGLTPEGTIQISSVDGATGLTRPTGLVTLSATADGKGPASIRVTGILQSLR